MTSKKVSIIEFYGVHHSVEERKATVEAKKARKVLAKVRGNMPYYTGMGFEVEIDEFEKAGLTDWIEALIKEMEGYL